jgi:hypothetical protein
MTTDHRPSTMTAHRPTTQDHSPWTISPAIIRVVERIIVRRGRFVTYEQLRRTFGSDPNVEIVWDRRRPVDLVAGDESVPESDRRGQPPAEWQQLDYFFASGRRPDTPDTEPPGS